MKIAELTAYAAERYHIQEQHKWADFPGLSVLSDPDTGKWIALLMRQWDTDTGMVIERCDLKCGSDSLVRFERPYLSPPIRMKGNKWIGIAFDCRHTLARGRSAVEKTKAAEKALRDPSDHAGVADDQQAYEDPVALRRSALYRH